MAAQDDSQGINTLQSHTIGFMIQWEKRVSWDIDFLDIFAESQESVAL
jgi:hypothetical protein